MSAVKAYKNFLSFLSELSLSQVKALLSFITPGQVRALKEVLVNILAGNVNLTAEQKRQLAPYKSYLRKFAKSSIRRCKSNKACRAVMLALKAAKSTFNQL